jgi:MFS family permease
MPPTATIAQPTSATSSDSIGDASAGFASSDVLERLDQTLDASLAQLDTISVQSSDLDVERPSESGHSQPPVSSSRQLRPTVTRTNLRASMADGATFGVMVGVGESYLAAFALAIGLGEISAGLVSSIPLLVGGILQLVSLRAVAWFGSEKRWILFCATLQGLSFFPLVWAAVSGSIALVPLLAIASLYWAGGLASGPPWNTWMESIVPARIRPSYFARRTRTSQICTLVGLVAGGTMLQWADNRGYTLLGFAAIFATAALFRIWSVFWLARHKTPDSHTAGLNLRRPMQSQPEITNESENRLTELATVRSTKNKSAGKSSESDVGISGVRLLSYLVAVQLMVQISGPYFAPYMLKQLEFSYSQFVTILAVGFLSKIIALSFWGRFTRRYGAKRLLWTGGVGLVPLAALWIVSDNMYQLALVQALSGVMWAAYELGFFLMFFETLPIEKRTRMLTYYNLASMIALCSGAFIGAAMLQFLGGDQAAYWVLFGVSSIGRFLALGLLFGAQLRTITPIHVCLRVLGVRLSTSTVDSPILSTLEDRPRDPSA